jgi:PPOX class probable F420-dependent enzyme
MTDVLPMAGTEFGDRVRRRLSEAKVIWLTTTSADGTPQPNPVWFVWQEPDVVLVFSQFGAARLGHIASRPRVALNFDSARGDIVVLAGAARLAPDTVAQHEHTAYLAKYEADMIRVCQSLEAFTQRYRVAIEITIEKVRGH